MRVSWAGAVLLQDGGDGVEHPVSYFSKKFNRHQHVYSTIEKEALALVLALTHFEVYVGSSNVPVMAVCSCACSWLYVFFVICFIKKKIKKKSLT